MPIISTIVSEVIKVMFGVLKENVSDGKQTVHDLESNLEGYLNEILKWSERIQFYGMSTAEATDTSTIELKLEAVPRKFRGKKTIVDTLTEASLLQDTEHYLLLGDPGSGKTTTLKRLARRMLEPPNSEEDTYQYPIVIRLRDLNKDSSLYTTIAQILGLKYEVLQSQPTEGFGIISGPSQVLIGDVPIQTAIPNILNATKCLLLLDGLDEVTRDRRRNLENEIRNLAYRMSESKLILTSRSGDFVVHFDGFNVIEICPLDLGQVKEIVAKWLDLQDEFIDQLQSVPYHDLADRPLFLTQLLFFYRNYGYLPEQPCAVYQKIVGLMLKEWDAERKVIRKSKYGGFDPERKMEFLAALSYHLTFKIKTKTFTRADLVHSYLCIHQAFNLPRDEADSVARELETHTGIIIDAGYYRYEFSHLSLQEYFCAYYLVRESQAERLEEYLREYPAPLAVAVVLSSNPSTWLASLLLREKSLPLKTEHLSTLLSRLIIEKPFFIPTPILGLAILKVFFDYGMEEGVYINFHLNRLLGLDGVKKSIALALTWYAIDPEQRRSDDNYVLKRRFHLANKYGFETPEGGPFPNYVLHELVNDYSAQLVVLQANGRMVVPFEESELSRTEFQI